MRWVPFVLMLAACPGPEEETDTPEPMSCEADGVYDVQVSARVEDASGFVGGATVELWDRGWTVPEVMLGSGTTGSDGIVTFMASGVTDVPGCWGTLLDYTLVAAEGGRTGEKQINTTVHAAITDGSLNANIIEFPVRIE